MKSEQTNDTSWFARAAGAFVALAFAFTLALAPSAAFASELDGNQAGDGQPIAGAATNANGTQEPGEGDGIGEAQGVPAAGGNANGEQEAGAENPADAAPQEDLGDAGVNEPELAATEVNEEWEFDVNDDVIELTNYKNKGAKEVTVPNEIAGYEGKSVVVNNGTFDGMQETLEKVVFGEGVKIKDGAWFFAFFTALKTVEASGLDLSECENMEKMFYRAESLVEVDLSGSDASSCESMDGMFADCTNLTTVNAANLKLNTTGSLNMHTMFLRCKNLSELDTTNWDTSGVTNMANMFEGCESLSALDVSGWDVGKVTNFNRAFYGLPGTTVLDLRKWNATSVIAGGVTDDEGKTLHSGWEEAFHGPFVLVGDGQMAQRVESGENRADGKYIGIDYMGYYGVFLEDSMERVWCLNYGIAPPSDNPYTRYTELLDEEGLQRLSTVFRAADTQMDKQERWEKIAAAITFFGNVLDADVQETLQYTIWHYSDNLTAPEGTETEPIDDDEQAKIKAMVEYVEANWQSLDYSGLMINFYDSDTEPLEPWHDGPNEGTYDGKFQNLISLSTAETVRHKDAGKLVISKEVATESNKGTEQVFEFTVKLENADGAPYTRFVQAASEGEELHAVAPGQDGVITLATTGAGIARIEDLPAGVTYAIAEASVTGWFLVSATGDKGTIVKDATSTATFTNDKVGAETSATVRKVWDDKDDKYQKRPASITVTLSNGAEVTLSAENDWTATVDNLPKYDATGKLIEYTWTESDMPEGYKLSGTSVDGTVTTLTNSYTAEKKDSGKTEEKAEGTLNGGSGGMTQTGDAIPAWPFAIAAIASLAVLMLARRKQRDC